MKETLENVALGRVCVYVCVRQTGKWQDIRRHFSAFSFFCARSARFQSSARSLPPSLLPSLSLSFSLSLSRYRKKGRSLLSQREERQREKRQIKDDSNQTLFSYYNSMYMLFCTPKHTT